jgi:hypothetical protein
MFDRCLRLRISSVTLASGGRRSIQLSYGRCVETGIVKPCAENVKGVVDYGRETAYN